MARKTTTSKLIFVIIAAAFAFFYYSKQDGLNVLLNYFGTGRVSLPSQPRQEIDKTVKQFTATVIRVHDGDTITVRDAQGAEGKIRMYGIDAPELAQTYGDKSRAALAGYVDGKTVDVEVMDTDQYGRMVSLIGDVNKKMVETGNAWVYVNYCKIPDCKDWQTLEDHARDNGLGLWKEKSPTPPWKWRKANK